MRIKELLSFWKKAIGCLALIKAMASSRLGHFFGDRLTTRFFRSEKSKKRLAWAERMLAERGPYLSMIARFIPGGRTVTMFTAGFVKTFAWRRFIVFDAIACLIWGAYAVLLGYFGGRTFEEEPWKGLLLAFGIAIVVTAVVEAVRHLRRRRAKPA